MSDCIHETNPHGGFAQTHGRLCAYDRSCFNDAVVHVRVVETSWCGNVCGSCKSTVGKYHRIEVSNELRGLEA